MDPRPTLCVLGNCSIKPCSFLTECGKKQQIQGIAVVYCFFVSYLIANSIPVSTFPCQLSSVDNVLLAFVTGVNLLTKLFCNPRSSLIVLKG